MKTGFLYTITHTAHGLCFGVGFIYDVHDAVRFYIVYHINFIIVFHCTAFLGETVLIYESHDEKTRFLPMGKQRCRSAVQ